MEASGTQKAGSVGIKDQVARAIVAAITPTGRWICAVAALVIGMTRLVQGRAFFNFLPVGIYVVWFLFSGIGLLATSEKPYSYGARAVAAIAAGAFITLATDALSASVTSGLIAFVFAWRMAWEAVRDIPR